MSEKAQDFILERLSDIVEKISTIKVKYDFDEFEDEHLIEVSPIEEFENNVEFKTLKADLILDYTNAFFGTIMVVSSNHLLGAKHDSQEFLGSNYGDCYLGIDSSDLMSDSVWELFAESLEIKIIDDNFVGSKENVNSLNKGMDYYKVDKTDVSDNLSNFGCSEESRNCNNNYALAA